MADDEYQELREVAKSLSIPDDSINDIVTRIRANYISMNDIRDPSNDLRYMLGAANVPAVLIMKLEQRALQGSPQQSGDLTGMSQDLSSSSSLPLDEKKSKKRERTRKPAEPGELLARFQAKNSFSPRSAFYDKADDGSEWIVCLPCSYLRKEVVRLKANGGATWNYKVHCFGVQLKGDVRPDKKSKYLGNPASHHAKAMDRWLHNQSPISFVVYAAGTPFTLTHPLSNQLGASSASNPSGSADLTSSSSGSQSYAPQSPERPSSSSGTGSYTTSPVLTPISPAQAAAHHSSSLIPPELREEFLQILETAFIRAQERGVIP